MSSTTEADAKQAEMVEYIIEKLEALKEDNDNKKILSDLEEKISKDPNIDNKELLLLSLNVISLAINESKKSVIDETIDGVIESQKIYIE